MFKIPDYDEDPSDEMVEFLHGNPEKWYGDECGIILIHNDGSEEEGVPGDSVFKDEDGVYHIRKAET